MLKMFWSWGCSSLEEDYLAIVVNALLVMISRSGCYDVDHRKFMRYFIVLWERSSTTSLGDTDFFWQTYVMRKTWFDFWVRESPSLFDAAPILAATFLFFVFGYTEFARIGPAFVLRPYNTTFAVALQTSKFCSV